MIVHMIGNAHLDPVWLWRWETGVDEALATFTSAVQRCDEYPEFIYTRGEAWLYRQVEGIAPDLFARVRELVAAGRWHVTGGQWVQPDANAPTEEGWRRQFQHGRRYFEDRFGVRPTVAYNVDTFGHPATLPDILAPLGYRAYVFHRPDPSQMTLPAQTFRWRGPGGHEILGFRIVPVYATWRHDLRKQIMLSVKYADPDLGHTMCFYGVGNHGGGPTKTNIEYILEHTRAFDGIELRFSTPEAFVDAVAPSWACLPVVTEELQHCNPGCYSVMHDIKQRQRRGEHLLDQAARVIDGLVEDRQEQHRRHATLDQAWDDLLFTQFHDILAGTSVPAAWSSVRAMQGRAQIIGEEIIAGVTRRWARRSLPLVNHQQLVLYNADDAAYKGIVEAEPFLDFDHWGERWVSDREGRPIPFQLVQAETEMLISRILVPAEIAPRSPLQLLVRDDQPSAKLAMPSDLEVSPTRLANAHLQLGLGREGIASLASGGLQYLGSGGIRLHLRADHADTWAMHTDRFDESVDADFESDSWIVEETGPLRARVRAAGRLGASPVRWTLSLHAGDPRLHMRVETTFSERYHLLQMAMELPSAASSWTAGLAGGQVQRAAGPAEWPVQGWARLEAGAHSLALVTGDAYSASLDGGRWQWTLLRGPRMAWDGTQSPRYVGRDWFTDQGEHTFDFVLFAGTDVQTPELERAARQQAQPPIVFGRYEGMNRPPWGDTPPRHAWPWSEERVSSAVLK